MKDLIYKEESYAIVGACFEVYNQMGAGFLEAVYQECLEIEFRERKIPFMARKQLVLRYKQQTLKAKYVPDFVCHEKIILEIKALSDITNEHRAQVHNYLRATGMKLGLLVNFGAEGKVQSERIVR
jgi:GxxExxY protein